MAFLLLLPLIVVALAEIAVFVQVAHLIGLGPALLTLLAMSLLGAGLMRSQGLATVTRARAALQRRELPIRELFDGACILIGGVLLLLPGFLTDVLGILLLLPPMRTLLRGLLLRWLAGRRPGDAGPGRRAAPPVIDVEFEEVPDRTPLDRRSGDRR